MEDNVLAQIRNLKIVIKEKEKNKFELIKQAEDIKKIYDDLMDKVYDFDTDINDINNKITELEKCKHGDCCAEFCYKNFGQTNYRSYCLCCGSSILGIRENLELHKVIDGREYVKNSRLNVSEIIEKAKEEYHLLRDCYYKYPGVLDDKKLDTTIYKVMQKRYKNK